MGKRLVATLTAMLGCGTDGLGPPAPTVASVEVSPSSDSLDALGASRAFTAVARDQSGQSVEQQIFIWQSLDSTVARVSSNGVATATGNGSTSITASAAGVTGGAQLRVAQVAVAVALSLPDTMLALNGTLQLAAQVRDRLGALVPAPVLTWSSSNTEVLTVGANGLATARALGKATVRANVGAVSDSAQITVRGVVAAVTLFASRVELTAIADTVYVRAEARDSAGGLVTGESVSWTSTQPAVATVSTAGLVTARANGTTIIHAEIGGVSAGLGVTVLQTTARLVVTPDTAILPIASQGASLQLDAVAYDANGYPVDPQPSTTWSGLTPSVASVSPAGLVSSLAYGSAVIAAVAAEKADTATVHVVPAVRQLSTSGYHTCVLTALDETLCWGRNSEGQLGTGDQEPTLYPLPSATAATMAQVSAGWFHTSGLRNDATAVLWGPGLVAVGADLQTALVAIGSAGQSEVIGLGADGHAYTLGDSSQAVDSTVVLSSLVTGFLHSCGLVADGTPFCWGYDGFGELGRDSGFTGQFVALTVGLYHTCGLTATGSAYCWGANGDGQLGDGTQVRRRFPVQVQGGQQFVALSAGAYHTCGLVGDGEVYCWGWNGLGQIGDGSTASRTAPEAVASPLAFTRIGAGVAHTCAESVEGRTWCWGGGAMGQIGNGRGENAPTPSPIAFPTDGQSSPPQMASGSTLDEARMRDAMALEAQGRVLCAAERARTEVRDTTLRELARVWRCR